MPHFLHALHKYMGSCKMNPPPHHFQWLFPAFRKSTHPHRSCCIRSGHKALCRISYQRHFSPQPRFHSNRLPLKGCFLCKHQRPPCEETASSSRMPSIYHIPPGGHLEADFHLHREWPNLRACQLWPTELLFRQSKIKVG